MAAVKTYFPGWELYRSPVFHEPLNNSRQQGPEEWVQGRRVPMCCILCRRRSQNLSTWAKGDKD